MKLLVTTALQDSWGEQEDVVFLGEWCKLYDDRNIWSTRNYSVITNHWDDSKKLNSDYQYLVELHERLLVDLSQSLNRHFNLEHPVRFWQTILDPWLLTYVAVIWDRWETLRMAFQKGRYMTIALVEESKDPVIFDYNHFISSTISHEWNHFIFLKIIASYYSDYVTILKSSVSIELPQPIIASQSSAGMLAKVKNWLMNFADKIAGFFQPQTKVMFYLSYFSLGILTRLNIRLGQIPRLYLKDFEWPGSVFLDHKIARSESNREDIKIKIASENHFEDFLFSQLVNDLPYVYLEGFKATFDIAKKLPYEPKLIFTANAHWHNELFKLWSATKILDGVKLITMEHGGGLHQTMNCMFFEEDIADFKTMWVKPYHPKHVRLYPNKLPSKNVKSKKENLSIVGFENTLYNYRIEASPKTGQLETHNQMIYDLYSNLSRDVQEHFRIRPYPNMGWNTRQQYIDRLGEERVSSERKYSEFLSKSKIIVCTYPQTTFSEAMVSGLPVILVYPAQLWQTLPQMDPLIESLKSAKILFNDPISAAQHVNSVWRDTDRWWNGEDVLLAKKTFFDMALTIDGDLLTEWYTFIKSIE